MNRVCKAYLAENVAMTRVSVDVETVVVIVLAGAVEVVATVVSGNLLAQNDNAGARPPTPDARRPMIPLHELEVAEAAQARMSIKNVLDRRPAVNVLILARNILCQVLSK